MQGSSIKNQGKSASLVCGVYIQLEHGLTSKIGLFLETQEVVPRYFFVGRQMPAGCFSVKKPSLFHQDTALYCGDLKIDSSDMVFCKAWIAYYMACVEKFGLYTCADVVQWFLNKYMGIRTPYFFTAPITINHFALGISVPSILPNPLTLPGRIFDNVQFYLKSRQQKPREAYQRFGVGLVISVLLLIGLGLGVALLTNVFLLCVLSTLCLGGLMQSVNYCAMGYHGVYDDLCYSPHDFELFQV